MSGTGDPVFGGTSTSGVDRLAYSDTEQTRELQARIAELEKKCEMLSDALYDEEEDSRGHYDREHELLRRINEQDQRRQELEALARGLVCNLPPCEIDLAHVVWGNTNAHLVMEARGALARALGVRHVWPEEDSDGAQTES